VSEGRPFIGMEAAAWHPQAARERITAAILGYRDDDSQMVLA